MTEIRRPYDIWKKEIKALVLKLCVSDDNQQKVVVDDNNVKKYIVNKRKFVKIKNSSGKEVEIPIDLPSLG